MKINIVSDVKTNEKFIKNSEWVLGLVHTETFSCVFVLLLFSRESGTTSHYLKQYKNAEKRFRVYGAFLTYSKKEISTRSVI